jgi:hypothetical protein
MLVEAGNVFDDIQHSFITKVQSIGIEKYLHILIKGIHEKLRTDIILNGGTLSLHFGT